MKLRIKNEKRSSSPATILVKLGLLAGTVTLVCLCIAGSTQRQYRLGGAWVGSGGGESWSAVVTPLDSDAKTAAFTVHPIAWDENNAGFTAYLGGDRVSDALGTQRMINNDTAAWSMVAYVLSGDPPKVVAIEVFSGTLNFTGPDDNVMDYTLKVYAAAADKDGDGYPDPGATPLMTIPNGKGVHKRLPSF